MSFKVHQAVSFGRKKKPEQQIDFRSVLLMLSR